jgi:hypothetical protein
MKILINEINNLIEEVSALTKIKANIARTTRTFRHVPLLLDRSNRINTIRTIGTEIKPNIKSLISQGVLGMDYPAITRNFNTLIQRKKINPVKAVVDLIPGNGAITATTNVVTGLNKADKIRQLQGRRIIPAMNFS